MSAQSYLLRGGQVCTMDPGRPWAQCVVVRGKMITYVGPEAGAVSFTDSGTEVIEVNGGMVLPGFIDAHNHLAGSGAMAKLGVELNGLSDPAEMLARIRDYAASHPGAVIRGSGWMAAYFENNSPTREMLGCDSQFRQPRPVVQHRGHARVRPGPQHRGPRPGCSVLRPRRRGMAKRPRG